MKLSVASWSFPQCTLEEVAGLANVLGFEGIDLGYFYRSSLDRIRVLEEPERYGASLRESLPLPVANLYHLFGSDPGNRHLADPRHRGANIDDFDKALAFCRSVGAPSIFVLPGILDSGRSRSQALSETVESVKPMLEAADRAGITVCVEPHVHSYLESPALAAELCEWAPGLKLALDYAHFIVLGYRQEEIDALAPLAGHVHLRQARPGALQTKFDQGTINISAMLATLRGAEYDGWLACEYVHQAYFDTVHEDVLTETLLMRDLVKSWRAAGPGVS